ASTYYDTQLNSELLISCLYFPSAGLGVCTTMSNFSSFSPSYKAAFLRLLALEFSVKSSHSVFWQVDVSQV
ncbi:hypothetical protein ACQP3F_29025, partial [Escherichia coli]